ncbi:hypothetical protein D0863_02258 [Hortaea werneckii]|uniref:F-box domain-containing protein n=1 Tax=Hortaea werneckii TaxID=91943 RepID=A0A3M7EHP8_HORWE|nr:hypothetical protein D0863_02258 [Hortaea werneckii]
MHVDHLLRGYQYLPKSKTTNHQIIDGNHFLSPQSLVKRGASMSAEHDSEVRDVMRQILCEMKRIDARLERMESRQKQIDENVAIHVDEETLQKTVTSRNAAKQQSQPSAYDSPAAEQFFSMPYLLEIMLLKLPMQDLLLAQRTCWRFKAMIDGSFRIRRALFLEPEPVAGERGAGTPRVNPLLTYESQLHRRRFVITKATFDCGRREPINIMVRVKDEGVGIERKHIDCFLNDATYFSHGSWRQMLAAQSLETALLMSRCGNRVYMPVHLGAPLTMEEVCNRTHKLG